MTEIIVGEKVLNKLKEVGTIISFDGKIIAVQYQNRVAKLQPDAFDKGFITYEKAELQNEIDERLKQAKEEKECEARAKSLADEKAKEMCRMMEAKAPVGVKFNSVSIRLDPAPAGFSSVKAKHRKLVEEIFDKCDKDINALCESFTPNMKYITPHRRTHPAYFLDRVQEFVDSRPEHLRSRYAAGFLMKYDKAYVFRVVSRNDIYTPGRYGGFTVTKSDTTEILRILCIDGETYYFSKNLSCDYNEYKNTALYKKWQKAS